MQTVRKPYVPYVPYCAVTDHNETNSLSFMQRNLRHIWVDMMHYRPPSDIFFWGGRVPLPPAGFMPLLIEKSWPFCPALIYCSRGLVFISVFEQINE